MSMGPAVHTACPTESLTEILPSIYHISAYWTSTWRQTWTGYECDQSPTEPRSSWLTTSGCVRSSITTSRWGTCSRSPPRVAGDFSGGGCGVGCLCPFSLSHTGFQAVYLLACGLKWDGKLVQCQDVECRSQPYRSMSWVTNTVFPFYVPSSKCNDDGY